MCSVCIDPDHLTLSSGYRKIIESLKMNTPIPRLILVGLALFVAVVDATLMTVGGRPQHGDDGSFYKAGTAAKYNELQPVSMTSLPIQHPQKPNPLLKDVTEKSVTLIIKYMSKFRQEQVNALLKSIQQFYPNIRVLVGDDTHERKRPNDPPYVTPTWAHDNSNIKLLLLPEDCGLSMGRNILVQSVQTPYFVLLDDDFLFTKYTQIEKFLGILLHNPDVDIVGGGLSNEKSIAPIPHGRIDRMLVQRVTARTDWM